MTEKEMDRLAYQTPVVVPLGAMAVGVGQDCGTGTAAPDCETGNVASQSCEGGNSAEADCTFGERVDPGGCNNGGIAAGGCNAGETPNQ